jgi:hypothetical protein
MYEGPIRTPLHLLRCPGGQWQWAGGLLIFNGSFSAPRPRLSSRYLLPTHLSLGELSLGAGSCAGSQPRKPEARHRDSESTHLWTALHADLQYPYPVPALAARSTEQHRTMTHPRPATPRHHDTRSSWDRRGETVDHQRSIIIVSSHQRNSPPFTCSPSMIQGLIVQYQSSNDCSNTHLIIPSTILRLPTSGAGPQRHPLTTERPQQ